MPGPTASAEHGTDTRYGYGCRCADCRIAHADVSREWKFQRRYGDGASMGPAVRSRVLTSLRTTRSVPDTAKALGLTHQAIYAACGAIPEFGDQVDELTRAKD